MSTNDGGADWGTASPAPAGGAWYQDPVQPAPLAYPPPTPSSYGGAMPPAFQEPVAPAPALFAAPPAPQLPVVAPPAPTWTTVASSGSVTFAYDASEYVVFDDSSTYGRWPRTDEGYEYATRMYQSRVQSTTQAVVYATTGQQSPAAVGLPSVPVMRRQSYAAPLSFVGSTSRIVDWARSAAQRNPRAAVPIWILASLGMIVAWAVVACWYVIIFGLFGVFVIPWRLMRRGNRKELHTQQTALATQQAMLLQQQEMLQQLQSQQAQQQFPPPPHQLGR